MKTLLLGATGLIGAHIAHQLAAAGTDLRIMSRSPEQKANIAALEVEVVHGDLMDPEAVRRAMRGCSRLYHAAAHYPKFSLHPMQEVNVGLQGLRNVWRAADAEGIERAVYTSSLSTIGRPASGEPATEDVPYNYKHIDSVYHNVKYAMELETLKFVELGLPVVIVNPTFCIGEYEMKPPAYCFLPRIANMQVPAYVPGPVNVVDARDVASGHLLAMEKGKVGRRYLLGNENMLLGELIRRVARLAGVIPPLVRLPYGLALSAAYLSERWAQFTDTDPYIPMVGIHEIHYSQFYDCSRAVHELGMPQSPIDEAIERGLAWFTQIGYIR